MNTRIYRHCGFNYYEYTMRCGAKLTAERREALSKMMDYIREKGEVEMEDLLRVFNKGPYTPQERVPLLRSLNTAINSMTCIYPDLYESDDGKTFGSNPEIRKEYAV